MVIFHSYVGLPEGTYVIHLVSCLNHHAQQILDGQSPCTNFHHALHLRNSATENTENMLVKSYEYHLESGYLT